LASARSAAKSPGRSKRAVRGRRKAAVPMQLWNEVLAALGAARIEHRAATARFHAGAETMGAGVLELAGLESTFHVTARKIVGKDFEA
jgi:hypothetical protein